MVARADVAHHHQARVDADAHRERGVERRHAAAEALDLLDDLQPGAHRALRIVLVRPGVAEIDQHAVAHEVADMPLESPDDFAAAALIGGDDLVQILGVEAR